jgi:hypothetical protein
MGSGWAQVRQRRSAAADGGPVSFRAEMLTPSNRFSFGGLADDNGFLERRFWWRKWRAAGRGLSRRAVTELDTAPGKSSQHFAA